MPRPAPDLLAVRLLVLDVDGVLTDGALYLGAGGDEFKRFHVRDGSGIKVWMRAGHRVAFVSGRDSPAVTRRAQELGVSAVFQGVADKSALLTALLSEYGLAEREVAAVGDDLQDLPLLRRAGVAIAVADACSDVRAEADYVTMAPGGHGAVRDAVEWILRAQDLWAGLVAPGAAAG